VVAATPGCLGCDSISEDGQPRMQMHAAEEFPLPERYLGGRTSRKSPFTGQKAEMEIRDGMSSENDLGEGLNGENLYFSNVLQNNFG